MFSIERLLGSAAGPWRVRAAGLIELLLRDQDPAVLSELGRVGLAVEIAHSVKVMASIQPLAQNAPRVRSPVVIGGLPRTGTTYLHRMLASCGAFRAPLGWEAHDPGSDRPIHEVQAEARDRAAAAEGASPALHDLHPLSADDPEECTPLLQHTLVCAQWGMMIHCPTYLDALEESDYDDVYAAWAAQLGAIDPSEPAWLLKSPLHMFGYRGLARHTTGLVLVQIRRDPVAVMEAFLNLCLAGRRIFEPTLDPAGLGPPWLERMARALDRATADLGTLDVGLIVLEYDQLVSDPTETVRSLLRRLGAPDCAAFDIGVTRPSRLERRFGLEAFGLRPAQVADRLRSHCDGPFLVRSRG